MILENRCNIFQHLNFLFFNYLKKEKNMKTFFKITIKLILKNLFDSDFKNWF